MAKVRNRTIETVRTTSSYVFLTAIGITMLIPFAWMLITSFNDLGNVTTTDVELIPTVERYRHEGKLYSFRRANVDPAVHEYTALSGRYAGETFVLKDSTLLPDAMEPQVLQKILAEQRTEAETSPEELSTDEAQLRVPLKQGRLVREAEMDITFTTDDGERMTKHVSRSEIVFQRGTLENYKRVIRDENFGRYYLNSVFVALCVTVGQVLTSAMAAYAFARLRFPGRDKIFVCYLATLMIPVTVTLIPLFVLMSKLGWVNSYKALIFPVMFSAYGTFLLRQFFMTLPRGLEEAAMIDGAGHGTIFFRIILPLSKPALATLSIFVFMAIWRSFFWPVVIISDNAKMPLSVGLSFFRSQFQTEWTMLMAGTVIMILPVILVFIIGQRFFVEGIKLGGIKG